MGILAAYRRYRSRRNIAKMFDAVRANHAPRKVSRTTPNAANEVKRRVLARFPDAANAGNVWFTGSNVWSAVFGEAAPAGADWDIIVSSVDGSHGLGGLRAARQLETLGLDKSTEVFDTTEKPKRRGESREEYQRNPKYAEAEPEWAAGKCYKTVQGEVDVWKIRGDLTAALSAYPGASHAHCRAAFSLTQGLVVLPNEMAVFPQHAVPAPSKRIGLRAIIGAALLGVLIGLLLLSAGCCGQLAAPAAPKPLAGRTVSEQADNAVLVTRECAVVEGVFIGRGSGTVIAPGTVLTAMHVVTCAAGSMSLGVIRADGTSAAAHVVWRDAEHDLALLAAVGITPSGVVSHAFTATGQTVCAEVSYPERKRMCGVVTKRTAIVAVNGVLDIHSTITTVPGNSGAGIYDALGRLVGVVTNRTPCAVDVTKWCGNLSASQRGRLPW